MLRKSLALELFEKGKELKDLGYKLEGCREKINMLSKELCPSDPAMLELEKQFDELLLKYMKKEKEAKGIVHEKYI